MNLTDPPLLGLLVALTALAFVAAVVLTARLRRGWLAAVGRALLILLVVVLTLATTGAYLNDANGWYASWSDLAGIAGAQQVATRGPGAAAAAAGRSAATGATAGSADSPGPGSAPSISALPSPGQRMQTYTYRGPVSGVTGQIDVYLPAAYQSPAAAGRRYPVLEAFHGYPGSPSGWTHTMGLESTVDGLVNGHRIAPPIVVVPQIDVPLGQDGECVDAPAGPRLETWLTRDVPVFVEQRFRVEPQRSGWATMGYSAGGWCSAMAGVLHPDTYGAAIVLSGYFAPSFSTTPPAGTASVLARYNLVQVVRRYSPAVALWIQAGRQSPYWGQTQTFLSAVRPPTSVTTVIQSDTGHRWSVWKAQLPVALTWLGGHLPGFAP